MGRQAEEGKAVGSGRWKRVLKRGRQEHGRCCLLQRPALLPRPQGHPHSAPGPANLMECGVQVRARHLREGGARLGRLVRRALPQRAPQAVLAQQGQQGVLGGAGGQRGCAHPAGGGQPARDDAGAGELKVALREVGWRAGVAHAMPGLTEGVHQAQGRDCLAWFAVAPGHLHDETLWAPGSGTAVWESNSSAGCPHSAAAQAISKAPVKRRRAASTHAGRGRLSGAHAAHLQPQAPGGAVAPRQHPRHPGGQLQPRHGMDAHRPPAGAAGLGDDLPTSRWQARVSGEGETGAR